MSNVDPVLVYVFDENPIHVESFESMLSVKEDIQLKRCTPDDLELELCAHPGLVMINLEQAEYCVHLMLLKVLRHFPEVMVIGYSATGWILPTLLIEHPGQLVGLSYHEVAGALQSFSRMERSQISSFDPSSSGAPCSEELNLVERVECLASVELDVFFLVGKGYGAPEIADILSRSKHTVSTHIKNLGKKLQVSGILGLRRLAFWYARSGICRAFFHSDDHICSCLNQRVGTCPILNSSSSQPFKDHGPVGELGAV